MSLELHILHTSYYKLHLSLDNFLVFSLMYTRNPLEADPTASMVPWDFSWFLCNMTALSCQNTNESIGSGRNEHPKDLTGDE